MKTRGSILEAFGVPLKFNRKSVSCFMCFLDNEAHILYYFYK